MGQDRGHGRCRLLVVGRPAGGTGGRCRGLFARGDRLALRRRHRFAVLAADRPQLELQPVDRRQHLCRSAVVSQPGQRITWCPGAGPHSARLRGSATGAADLRVRRHHRRPETHCATAGLDCAGCRMANRGLRRGRLSTGPGLSMPDAERAARRRLLLPAGVPAARRRLPHDRHRSPLGQKDRRPRRRLRTGGLRRPCRRAGRLRAADTDRRESAHHPAAAGGDRPRRPGGRLGQRQDPLPAAQRGARGRRHTRPAARHLPRHDDHHGVRQHHGAVTGGHPNGRRRRVRVRPAHAVRGVLGGRSGHRGTGARTGSRGRW